MKEKNLDLARELRKLWNMKVPIVPIVIGAFVTVTEGLIKGLEDFMVGGRVETILTTTTLLRILAVLKNSQNTEKSPGDLRRLAVTQTSGKPYQLTLMCRTRQV